MSQNLYDVWIYKADGTGLQLNGAGCTAYAAEVQGLWDLPTRDVVLSGGYQGGSTFIDSRRAPRQWSVLVTILAGLNRQPIRNDLHNAARDALLRMLPEGETVTLRTQYPREIGPPPGGELADGPPDSWDLVCFAPQVQWQPGSPQYLITGIAPDPTLISSTLRSHAWALPDAGHEAVTFSVTVNGNVAATPILTLTPTAPKTDRWNFQRVYTLTNPNAFPLVGYPVALPFDFAWHLAHGRLVGDGSDLRVQANDRFIGRWWSAPMTAALQLWTEVDLPALGTLTVRVTYGNLSGTGQGGSNPTAGPIFDRAASDNTAWAWHGAFQDPQSSVYPHTWAWHPHAPGTGLVPLQAHLGSPWEQDATQPRAVNVAGGSVPVAASLQGYAGAAIHHPCGIVAISHHGYTQYDSSTMKLVLRGRDPDTGALTDWWENGTDSPGSLTEYGPTVTTPDTPQEAVVLALRAASVQNSAPGAIGGADRVTLHFSTPPTVSGNSGTGTGDETPVYMLEATITNATTGEVITLTGLVTQVAGVWQPVTLDATEIQAVTMGGDPFYYAFAQTPLRGHWLRLVPGANTLTIRDVAVGGLAGTLQWRDRRL